MAVIFGLVSGLMAGDKFDQKTLFSKGTTLGGFGGTASFVGQINDDYAIFTGGELAFLLNHSLIIGGAGYGLVNGINISPAGTPEDSSRYLEMGYGGLVLGYIVAPSQLIHIRVSSLFALGGLGSHTRKYWNNDWDSDWNSDYDIYNDVFFVVQPTVLLELNFAKFCRVDIGASYRYMSDFNYGVLKAGDLDGLAVMAAINFGIF